MDSPEALAERYRQAGLQLLDNWNLLSLHMSHILSPSPSSSRPTDYGGDRNSNRAVPSSSRSKDGGGSSSRRSRKRKQPPAIKIDYSNMHNNNNSDEECDEDTEEINVFDVSEFKKIMAEHDTISISNSNKEDEDLVSFIEEITEEGFIPIPSDDSGTQEPLILNDYPPQHINESSRMSVVVPPNNILIKRISQLSKDLRLFVVRYEETLKKVIDQRRVLLSQQDLLVDQVATLRKMVPPELRSVKATIPIKPYIPSFISLDEQPPYIGIDQQHSHICMNEPGTIPDQFMEMATPISGRPSVQTKYHKHSKLGSKSKARESIDEDEDGDEDEEEEEDDVDDEVIGDHDDDDSKLAQNEEDEYVDIDDDGFF